MAEIILRQQVSGGLRYTRGKQDRSSLQVRIFSTQRNFRRGWQESSSLTQNLALLDVSKDWTERVGVVPTYYRLSNRRKEPSTPTEVHLEHDASDQGGEEVR